MSEILQHVLTIEFFARGLEIQSNFTRYVESNFSIIFQTHFKTWNRWQYAEYEDHKHITWYGWYGERSWAFNHCSHGLIAANLRGKKALFEG